VRRHRLGHTKLQNIHATANLLALCSLCHFAFDNDEWIFIPEDITNWNKRIEATPRAIEEYNTQRDITFRRLLLVSDPESPAFQDSHYKSAFTDRPTKMWPGEPGILIIRPQPNDIFPFSLELNKAIKHLRESMFGGRVYYL
jgi:hypothetical protein